jgi:hypothetical protein
VVVVVVVVVAGRTEAEAVWPTRFAKLMPLPLMEVER